ncbi:hypothetical protein GE21DRAFT_3850 [Neurospora crassa]|uniref:Uncharacterized protein n=1 Tax=Neurospora crassa (strain ATCC 24698 / 74-OR23-1A / CBS 708.71 / DSM 1257 / FGSC 987) TaxID=367110 RepID=Q7S325_NEUCR|nr:hypothetical protein NCU09190 [Neurospora crassa OR74A]EAA29864.1 hypothetical protein NCU09190 [Neurospora crassa OR74A]KHE84329.1 hypothetical protein GE21DRAFT_3850 [Neurospora crassa]|eukprot:XP_959100.1 hypothetical protein NCU09190 [Neurospora crassa OR74A]
MPPTGPWRTKDGKIPGMERRIPNPTSHIRFYPGDQIEGNGLDLNTILRKKAAAATARDKFQKNAGGRGPGVWGPSSRGRGPAGSRSSDNARTFDPAQFGLERDENIVWIEEPRRRFAKNQQGNENFAQVQTIIRQRLSLLGLDYAVVRTGPHEDQNLHDELGTVRKQTNVITGRVSNETLPADLHVTLYAGRKNGMRGDELYLQGHIYLQKVLRGNGENKEEYDYEFLSDPSKRKYVLWGERPRSEEWWLTPNTYPASSGPAPVLGLAAGTTEDLEKATASLKI